MNPQETILALQARLGGAALDSTFFRGEGTVLVAKDSILDACRFCHDDLEYDFLSDLTAVDYLDRDPRFDVVYHITSMKHWGRFRLKVQTNDGDPLPTVIPVWGAANWAEREVWDLFGVEFTDHPNLLRIMLPEGWIGHPLRKDVPQSQISLPRSKADKSHG